MPLFMPLFMAFMGSASFAGPLNLSKSGLALDGYDPVSYFRPAALQQGPLKGDPKFQAKHESQNFQFASEENKQEFLKNPTKYIPAFGGWCAYAVAEKKEKVEVDIKSFLIQEGRLLLFYKGFLADTRSKWQNNKNKSVSDFLKEADTHWQEIANKEP